jgi:hypothetical protein
MPYKNKVIKTFGLSVPLWEEKKVSCYACTINYPDNSSGILKFALGRERGLNEMELHNLQTCKNSDAWGFIFHQPLIPLIRELKYLVSIAKNITWRIESELSTFS